MCLPTKDVCAWLTPTLLVMMAMMMMLVTDEEQQQEIHWYILFGLRLAQHTGF